MAGNDETDEKIVLHSYDFIKREGTQYNNQNLT